MTARQEFASWFAPPEAEVHSTPDVNSKAPAISDITFPRPDGNPDDAEKIFLKLKKIAGEDSGVQIVAVSHSDEASTTKWVESIGGAGNIRVIVDFERKIYGQYGLGLSSFWHVLNPWSMAEVFNMGKREGIWNRPTESGSRWQSAGLFAVDPQGLVKYSHPSQTTDDLGDVDEALHAIK